MPLGPVILNNTPLVCLWLLGQFDLLRQLYAEVVVPKAVWAEFLAVESTPRQQALQQAPWLARTQLDNPQSALVFAGLFALVLAAGAPQPMRPAEMARMPIEMMVLVFIVSSLSKVIFEICL